MPERFVSVTCIKICSWKSQNLHVVKYDVYLHIASGVHLCNTILNVKTWTSNSNRNPWTRACLGPMPIGTRDPTRGPGYPDPMTWTQGPGPGDPYPCTWRPGVPDPDLDLDSGTQTWVGTRAQGPGPCLDAYATHMSDILKLNIFTLLSCTGTY